MNNLIATFRWECHNGRVLAVTEMETKHLFNTIRMVWNHSCPPELQLTPFKQWRLNLESNYLVDAITAMLIELSTRDDIQPYMIADIKRMNLHQTERISSVHTRLRIPQE